MPTGYNPYFHLLAVDYFWTSGSLLHPPAVVDPVICRYLISATIAGGGISIHWFTVTFTGMPHFLAAGNSSAPVFQPSQKFMGPLRSVDSSLFLITNPQAHPVTPTYTYKVGPWWAGPCHMKKMSRWVKGVVWDIVLDGWAEGGIKYRQLYINQIRGECGIRGVRLVLPYETPTSDHQNSRSSEFQDPELNT
ncbi:hypothetical protein C8R48DRAFT_678335 [Suillus tomentosus]|nr:hypothetical protein C8R48DRAFT_678335 [Suillus tomentosus]